MANDAKLGLVVGVGVVIAVAVVFFRRDAAAALPSSGGATAAAVTAPKKPPADESHSPVRPAKAKRSGQPEANVSQAIPDLPGQQSGLAEDKDDP